MRTLVHRLFRRSRYCVIALVTLLAGTTAAASTLDPLGVWRVPRSGTHWHNIYVGIDDNWLIVDGDGDTDLDCFVYLNGREVDRDTDGTDYCVLRTPGIGWHRLKVRNYGSVYNEYEVRQDP